jgi:hypothetical protein
MGKPGHRLPSGLAGDPGGAGEGSISGVHPGAPSRSEAAGDLAEDDRGPDLPLGTIVGGGHAAIGQEQEVLASPSLDLGLQFAAGTAGGRDRQEIVEPAFGLGVVLGKRRVSKLVSSPADTDGPAQQLAQLGSEGFVAAVDGRLDPGAEDGRRTWARQT